MSEVKTAKFYTLLLNHRGTLYAQEMPSVDARSLAEVIRAHTRPDDSIWVYSAAPELYWLSGRKPATSHQTASWITIGYNELWFERTYRELAREQPKLIIDLEESRYQKHGERLAGLPLIREFIAENYACRTDLYPRTTICRSKHAEGQTRGD